MIVTSKIKLDMAQPGTANPVFVVQGDGNTRAVEADLLANGSSWAPDDGWEAAITYRKPDGTKGLYNLLDDGSSAINISGSTATVILAQQMMTVPGAVRAAIVFNNQRLDQLTSFPFIVSVARNQFAGAQQSEDYIRLQWLEDKLEEYLRKAADSGAFDGAPGADGHTPVYGVDYGTPEQIAGIANQAAEILQPEVNQIKDDKQDRLIAGKNITISVDGRTISASGGDFNAELIESITLTEEVKLITRTREPNGTIYNFKGYVINLYFPDTAGEFSLLAYARQGVDNHLASIVKYQNWKKMKVRIELNANSGSWNSCLYSCNANGVAQNSFCGFNDLHFTSNSLSNILKLSGIFPSGTVVHIYAIRG